MLKHNQEVVAIKSHSQGLFTKGQHFVVESIRTCGCGIEIVKLFRLAAPSGSTKCNYCLKVINDSYFNAKMFAPIESVNFAKELIEEMTEEIEEEQLILK
jgi:hypothetical protein